MKRKLLAAILATSAIAFSCTVQETGSLQKEFVTDPDVTIADFVYTGPATKTTLSLNENVASFAFTAGDVLRAYPVSPEIGDGLRFTIKENKGASCIFEGDGFGLEPGLKYAAYYPGGSEVVPDVTAVPVDFSSQSQPAASEWNLSNVDFLYATGIEPVNGACSFSMKHLGALLIIDVTFETAGTYKELVLTSSMQFIVSGTLDLTADDESGLFAYDVDEDLADSITLTLGDANGMSVEAGQTVTFFMMMAPDDMQSEADLTVTLTDVDGNDSIIKEGQGFNFESGKAYKFGCTVEAPLPGINLSAEETANSYIVSEAGDYYFSVDVAGNGAAGVMPNVAGNFYPAGGTYNLPLGVLASAPFAVHFNENNCIENVVYHPEHNAISFHATGNEGNAKISVNGTNGVPMWTWLIWCTDQPDTFTYTTDMGNSITIMDRNLGATMASISEVQSESDIAKLCGLYYQWGRPIPFIADQLSTGTSFTGETAISQAFTFYYPTFLMYSASSWYAPFNWGDATLGGFTKGSVSNLWGNNNVESVTWRPVGNIQKTIYDPCPPGYQVAPADFMHGFTNTNASADLTADNWGVYRAVNEGTVYFPYNGKCSTTGMCSRWNDSRMVSLSAEADANDGCSVCIWSSGSDNGCYGWGWTANYSGQTSAGCSTATAAGYWAKGIRCVADGK